MPYAATVQSRSQTDPLPLRVVLLVVQLVSIVLIVFFLLRLFFIEHYTVLGPSMNPTLVTGQDVYANKLSYRFKAPERGDIVVFVPPNDSGRKYVKRIIGLPGEKVEIDGDGQVIIYNDAFPNGISLDETYLAEKFSTTGYTVDKLRPDEYFVMGDNRAQSSDSRGDIGAGRDDELTSWNITRDDIVGKVFVRVKPLGELRYFGAPDYNL
jgi:signal peptidase I